MQIKANQLQIEIDDSGDPGHPAVLLIMGLGMQLVAWPQPLVDGLVAAGFRVVRLDNRDIGLSQHLDHLGTPHLLWEGLKFRLGLPVRAPYGLADMAADAVGVLDALGISQAHVVGASMGGMIAQRMAMAAPHRVLSLTSVMSTSGARGLPQAQAHVLKALLSRPRSRQLDDLVDHAVHLFRLIGSPGFPTPEDELRARVTASITRAYHPAGVTRQMAAIMADQGRARGLAGIATPTLVVHGKADPLLPLACGEDTARRIPGASLVAVDGMGHDLARGVVQRLLAELVPFHRAHSPAAAA